MGIRMVIETHPGGRLSTHASRRHILGFREGTQGDATMITDPDSG